MGLTHREQRKIVKELHLRGMTLNGWARSRGYSVDTVKNCIYREWGRGDVGPITGEIIAKFKEEGLV